MIVQTANSGELRRPPLSADGEPMPGIKATMREYKKGKLHSGSKKGPVVKSRKQAIAIALNQGRKAKRGS